VLHQPFGAAKVFLKPNIDARHFELAAGQGDTPDG
jgi:hypothetical protein